MVSKAFPETALPVPPSRTNVAEHEHQQMFRRDCSEEHYDGNEVKSDCSESAFALRNSELYHISLLPSTRTAQFV